MKKRIVSPKKQRDLATICQRVIEKMENNPVFPNPPAALAELKKVTPEYADSLVKAKSLDKEMVAIKNNKKAIVVGLLEELGTYVLAICNDDPALILSSGFDVTDELTPDSNVGGCFLRARSTGRYSRITNCQGFRSNCTNKAPDGANCTCAVPIAPYRNCNLSPALWKAASTIIQSFLGEGETL